MDPSAHLEITLQKIGCPEPHFQTQIFKDPLWVQKIVANPLNLWQGWGRVGVFAYSKKGLAPCKNIFMLNPAS